MNNKIISLGDKKIGPGQPVYIVFEAGPTHDGFETAIKLIDIAAEAGADAIKFQILNAEKIVSSRDVQFTYTRLVNEQSQELEEVTEPLLDILKRREMKWDEWTALIKYCRKKGIEFFSTATDEEELSFLNANGVNTVKICSGDVNYHYFLRQAARYEWSIQLDTGASSLGEIEAAVSLLEDSGFEKIIINHCPSGYPARLESINLRIIPTLRKMFAYPIAFSDHSPGFEMDIAAVALGANMIEKTITLDRTIRSPEHMMSLNPGGCKAFIQTIRDLEIAMGKSRRLLSEGEKLKRINVRRSLFAACHIKKGKRLTQSMIHYSRPGDGIPADMDVYVIGRKAKKDIAKGSKLHFENFV
jgi:sialic acid synthase SpsE